MLMPAPPGFAGKLAILWIAPVLTIALSIPMVFGKIPPNRFYGFRTRKTLSNPDIWYRANRHAGIDLIVASLASLLASALLIPLLTEHEALFASVLVFAMGALLATGISLWRLRKL
ncbi:MAG: SdpI family protein [Candidatus Korobacteraceae bacterium]|jgi:uncharacterized membrane protein